MPTRYAQTGFWTDSKVQNKATPEDRYFMLYLLTNPHTNQLGCYELTIEAASFELGYKEQEISKLFKRMKERLEFATYDEDTQEVLIKNWYKYNWTKSPKVQTYILKELEKVKSPKFKNYLTRVCIPYVYPKIGYRYNYNNKNKNNYNYNNIYKILEEEFSRTISPLESEIVKNWEESNYNPKIIELAIKEAVLNNARSFKYIDKILYDWAKRGLKNEIEVKKYLKIRNEKSEEQQSDYEEF